MASYPIVSEMKFERLQPVVKTGKFYSKMGVKQSTPNASIIGTAPNQTLGFAIKIGEQTSPTNRGEAGQILNGILNADTQGQFAQTFSLFFKDFLNDLRKTFSFSTTYPSAPVQTHREGSIVFVKQKAEREFIQNTQNIFLNSCSDLMEQFLNENTDLKAAFFYESLSGNMKFDGKTGSAQVLLSSKKDGSDLAAIPLDMNFANTLAKTDRTNMNLNFTQTPNSSGGFFQNIMQKMSTLTESAIDVVMEIERIKDSISNPLAFMNAFEIQLSNVSFRSPIVYSDFYTPESDSSNFITINQGTNREQQITVPVRATYTPEGDQENVVEKGIDKILNEYMLINDYLVDNVNTNQMTLEEAYDFMCEEFGLLEKEITVKNMIITTQNQNKENRSKRVLARRKMEEKGRVHKGDGKDVDHKNGNPKDNSDDNLRVLSKSKNRSMNEDHGAGFEGTPELVNKFLQATPGSNAPFVGIKSIPYLESQLDKKLKVKKK